MLNGNPRLPRALSNISNVALETSKKVTSFFTIVEQNAEKPGPSGQKFSKPLLEELNEALKVLSDED